MGSPRVFLHENYKRKDGSCAVYILVHLNNKSLKFPTGVSCKPADFDQDTSRIKGKSQIVKDDNLTIEQGLARINDIMVRYRLQLEELTPELLKREWKNPARRVDFYAFFDEIIKDRKGDIAENTVRQHKSSISKLKKFCPKLAFSQIDNEFIDRYRRWLKTKMKNDINTVHNALKILKIYMNIARRNGVIDSNPFDEYKLKRAEPDRVYLTEEELEKLWTLYNSNTLSGNDPVTLRHFLFMCFTGVRISDLKSITHDNIVGNTLVFHPVKTKHVKKMPVKIPLNEFALQLVKDEGTRHGRIFNCISDQNMNERIKVIAKSIKILKNLSNHSGRHTFATLWLNKTKDVAALQKILGHSNISDTMAYTHINEVMLKEEMVSFNKQLFQKKLPDQSDPGATNKT